MPWTKAKTGAYMPYPFVPLQHAEKGSLSGLSFTAKDMFDAAGYPTSAGSPTMLALSGIKTESSPLIEKLLSAGARFDGKTVTDELAFSLIGKSIHFGTPMNGAAPDRLAGGSSSGAASAVSSGLCDIGLATDSGGSVRGPASECGLYGIRPTHGRLSLERCAPLCPAFDTAGFMTKTFETFARTAEVLFDDGKERHFDDFDDFKGRLTDGREASPVKPEAILLPKDILGKFGDDAMTALKPAFDLIADLFGEPKSEKASLLGLKKTLAAYQRLQGQGIWAVWGEWIEKYNPSFAPDVAARFAFARSMADEDLTADEVVHAVVKAHIEKLLGKGAVMVLPTLPGPAPLRTAEEKTLAKFRTMASLSFAVGGLAGVPWLTIPLGKMAGAPVGLSLIGAEGSDRRLVAIVGQIVKAAREKGLLPAADAERRAAIATVPGEEDGEATEDVDTDARE